MNTVKQESADTGYYYNTNDVDYALNVLRSVNLDVLTSNPSLRETVEKVQGILLLPSDNNADSESSNGVAAAAAANNNNDNAISNSANENNDAGEAQHRLISSGDEDESEKSTDIDTTENVIGAAMRAIEGRRVRSENNTANPTDQTLEGWADLASWGDVQKKMRREVVNKSVSILNESDSKPTANPLIGSTMYVYSGPNKGYMGKLKSEPFKGWMTIDYHKVRQGDCKLVDDGKANLEAIKKYFTERKHLSSIPVIKDTDIIGSDIVKNRDIHGVGANASVYKEPAVNPLIGMTVHIPSGIYKGLSGRVIHACSRGWMTLDNPLVTSRVHWTINHSHCQIVDDGKSDIQAIKEYLTRGHRNCTPSIISADQLQNMAAGHQQEVAEGDNVIVDPPSNPLIGSTVYVSAGIYTGLSGKLLSEHRSWWVINNPEIPKNVRCSNCEIVDDGKADMHAILMFCLNNKRWIPPIMKPQQLKRPVGRPKKSIAMNAEGGNMGHSSSIKNKRPAQTDGAGHVSEQKRQKVNRELGRLADHLKAGIHYRSHQSLINNQTLERSRYSNKAVVERRWDENVASGGHYVSEQPHHFCSVPENISTVANQVKEELLQRFKQGWNGSSDLVIDAYEVEKNAGYYRGHMSSDVSRKLRNELPGEFAIKETASRSGIVFLNTKAGQCECHFDRDSSALYLVSGYKEVKIAPPMRELDRPADGIMEEVNPFLPNERVHEGFAWQTVHMGPGSVLVIPKYWLHCIRSIDNTLALSFQIQLSDDTTCQHSIVPTKRIWTSQDICTLEEEESSDYEVVVAQKPSRSQKHCNISTKQTKSEMHSSSRRSSKRQRPICGVCHLNGFNQHGGREMWILRYHGTVTPNYLPEFPTQ